MGQLNNSYDINPQSNSQSEISLQSTAMSYECMNKLAPCLCDRVFKCTETHSRFRRNSAFSEHPQVSQPSFQYRAVKIWNDLDNNLKQPPSPYTFKKIKASLSNAS